MNKVPLILCIGCTDMYISLAMYLTWVCYKINPRVFAFEQLINGYIIIGTGIYMFSIKWSRANY